jgi:hypothetical protein
VPKPERYRETVDTFTTVAANLSELAQVSPSRMCNRGRRLIEIDCSCSIDSRDESAWGQGGDCEYGSMITLGSGVGDGSQSRVGVERNLLYAYDFWVPNRRYNDVALCIIRSNPDTDILFCSIYSDKRFGSTVRPVTGYGTYCMIVNIVIPPLPTSHPLNPIASPSA